MRARRRSCDAAPAPHDAHRHEHQPGRERRQRRSRRRVDAAAHRRARPELSPTTVTMSAPYRRVVRASRRSEQSFANRKQRNGRARDERGVTFDIVPDVILPVLDEAAAIPMRARAGCRPASTRSSSTTARPTTRREVARTLGARVVARTAARLRRGVLAPVCERRPSTSCASWTATARSTAPTSCAVAAPVLAGDADLVLGARAGRHAALAAPRATREPCLACELRRRTGLPLTDLGPMRAARRARPARARRRATAASAGRSRWCCGPRPPAGASTRSPVRVLAADRTIEGHRHRRAGPPARCRDMAAVLR